MHAKRFVNIFRKEGNFHEKDIEKVSALFMALLMVAGLVPFVGIESVVSSAASVWDGSSTASPTQSGNYYYIDNAAQFAGFAKQVRDGTSYSGKTVYLRTDIDLQNKSFDGIGWDNQFAGTFDGQGYTVSNVSRSVSHDGLALFPRVNNATIKNLTVDGITITNGDGTGATGALVGRSYNSVTVTNCYVKNVTISGKKAGGIVGAVEGNAYITDCATLGGSITSSYDDAGGILGWNNSSGTIKITRCWNTANITGTVRGAGIMSYGGGKGLTVTIENCMNYGTVTVAQDKDNIGHAGGIVAYDSWENACYIKNCANFGALNTNTHTGGIEGRNLYGWAYITGCFNVGNLTRKDGSASHGYGGIVAGGGRIDNCYNRGNIYGGGECAGIIGWTNGQWVNNSYSTASFSGSGSKDAISRSGSPSFSNNYYLNTGVSSSRNSTTSVSAATLKASDMPGKLNSSVYCQDTWGINSYYPIHQWWRNNYFYFTITFDANGGTASGTETGTYLYGKTLTAPEVTREGYIFSGWYTEESGGTVVGTAQKAQVTAGQTVGSNTCALTLNKAANTVNGSVTYYAHWTPVTYTVAYDGNGATGGSTASSTHTYDTAQALTANGYTREYDVTYNYNYDGAPADGSDKATYTFNGWKRDGDEKTYSNSESVKNLTATQGDTVTMYAQWTASSVTLPTATRVGYTFGGWYTDSACTENKAGDANDAYTPTKNTTLYAKWNINSYTVIFANYDGKAVKTEEVKYGEKATAPAENPTKPYDETYHYVFSGWSGFTDETVVTEDVTYTAEYTSVAHTYSSEVTTPSTCVKHGTTTYTCECGYSYTADDAAFAGHTRGDAVKENEVAATCTEAGSYDEVVRCTVCTAEISREFKTVEATGHDFTNAVNDKKYLAEEATCGMSPLYYVSCTNCGESSKGTAYENKFSSGEPLGHNLEHHDANNATCTADGNIEYYTCTRCKGIFKDAEGKEPISSEDTVIKANGHTEVIDAAKPATCTETGLTEGKHCSVCGEVLVKQETVAALDHDWGEWTVTTVPTCTVGGEETRICKNNESHVDVHKIDAFGHDFTKEVIDDAHRVSAATCTAKAVYKYGCTKCDAIGEETFEYGDALGHDFELVSETAATCTADGEKSYKCTRCDETKTEKINALGHDFELVSETAATCTADGEKSYKCTRCDETKSEKIDATGHSWGEWVTVKEPTATEKGLAKRTCSACTAKEEKTLEYVSEKNRIIQFVNIDRMHYVLDNDGEDYTVYKSGAVKWYTDKPLNFTVYTYSNFKYQTVIVKVDGVEISPNADGVYTVPAGESLAVVTVEGAVEDSDGTKLSFWEMIVRFFKKIFSAIAGLFGGSSGSKS